MDPKIIRPDDPKYKEIFQKADEAIKGSEGSLLGKATGERTEWWQGRVGNVEVEHAILAQGGGRAKIVFHFQKLPAKVMEKLSVYLYKEITVLMQPVAKISAGPSPEYRNQWDMLLFLVPEFEAPMIRDRILDVVKRFNP